MEPATPRRIRVFCDSEVLIAGSASTTGASHILLAGQADEKDMLILAAAIASEADFLATFNIRHFQPRKTAPLIFQPGKILSQIRQSLTYLLN
jgi:hypothetical protein